MKIYFVAQTRDGAWGGGNQFLKLLQSEWSKQGLVTRDALEADWIFVNSYQDIVPALRVKLRYPHKKVLHRLGPIFALHRRAYWRLVDRLVVSFAMHMADAVVFQSAWTKRATEGLCFKSVGSEAVIGNTVNPAFFFPEPKHITGKIKLITTSWSKNKNKGFDILEYLDNHLDFSRFDFTFVGNSPVTFKHIKQHAAIPSEELGAFLRASHIYIAPVRHDACSNGLLEALASGLPAVALNSGGNSEVVGEGGVFFEGAEDITAAIEKVAANYDTYRLAIRVPSIQEVSGKYLTLMRSANKARSSRFKALACLMRSVLTLVYVKFLDRLAA